ncbi:putative RNase H [Trypanosoma vivax]|nr:putative RNase H [Trypanosoma vivax]
MDAPEKPHDATVLQWARRVHFDITTPGGLKADAPEKDKVHNMRRVQRFRGFDYRVWTDGSVVLDVSSGAGAMVVPKDSRREKVVLGAESLACSYRAECVAMEAGLKRLVDVIELSKTRRTRVVAFTDSLSLLKALGAGPAAVEDAMPRRILDLILHIVRLRVSVNFQFVFSHCGVPRNEAADKAAEQGNAKPQLYPAWITDIVTGVERQVRNEMYRAFEEGRMPRTHRSALLDHVRPAPKHSKVDRLGESLLAQFRTGTSKHFGWLHRVLARKMDQLECRWCNAQVAVSDAGEEHPSQVTVADSETAPDLGIATRQSDPIICPLCDMVRSRRQAGVVHLVKIHGLERDCALALTKKARRAALTYKNGYTCHVCGEDFERRGLLVEHMAQHPPVVPTVEERPKRPREEDTADDGNALKCPWCAKKYTAHAWLRKHMLQKHPEKQLSRGGEEAQDAPVCDGEAEQEEQQQTEFVCQQFHRVLKSKTWLTRHKCEPTSIRNSEDSNAEEQSVTATCPICSKEYRYRWLLRQVLTKHPGHDESLRPQPRAKPKRREMRSEAQSQGEGSGPLGSGGDGDGDAERPRKRPRVGRHTEEEEGRDYVCGRCGSTYKQWYSLVWHARTHHKNATTVKRKMKDGTVAVTPLLQRSLQCPYCPMKCALKQYLTMHLQQKHGQPRREARHNSLKVECKESAAHLLECSRLRELRRKRGLDALKDGELLFSAQQASFLKELFKLESPSAPTPVDSELRTARAVKSHRSSTDMETTYFPSAAARRIGLCTARGMRKRAREADSLTKSICFKVSLDEAMMGSVLRSTSPDGLQSRGSSRESM